MLEESKKVVFEVIKNRLPSGYTFDQFLSATSGFEFLPVKVGGACVGAIMRSENIVHAAVLPQACGKWFNKSTLAWLRGVISKYDKAITKVVDGHEAGHAFAKRLGFVETGHSDNLTFYEKARA